MSESKSTHMGEAAHALREDLKELRSAAGEAAREKLDEARERARAGVEAGREKLRAARSSLEEHVREKPLQSLLIAAAVGVALGYMLRSRRD